MFVIPAINETNFEEILRKIRITETFSRWVQLDIADGKFVQNKTWNNPGELQAKSHKLKANIEVHLMIENPEVVINDWIAAGAKRIIIHLEAINSSRWRRMRLISSRLKVELGLAINPETPAENLIDYLSICPTLFIQILAVNPGLAGQKFQPAVLEKIRFLKKKFPKVLIEVDGGINLKTAKLIKSAGADVIVAASYIWNNSNPQKRYNKLILI